MNRPTVRTTSERSDLSRIIQRLDTDGSGRFRVRRGGSTSLGGHGQAAARPNMRSPSNDLRCFHETPARVEFLHYVPDRARRGVAGRDGMPPRPVPRAR